MTIESDGHHLFTSVAWDLAHEQLVLADYSGVVQVWNTYTGSVRDRDIMKKIPMTLLVRLGQRKRQNPPLESWIPYAHEHLPYCRSSKCAPFSLCWLKPPRAAYFWCSFCYESKWRRQFQPRVPAGAMPRLRSWVFTRRGRTGCCTACLLLRVVSSGGRW